MVLSLLRLSGLLVLDYLFFGAQLPAGEGVRCCGWCPLRISLLGLALGLGAAQYTLKKRRLAVCGSRARHCVSVAHACLVLRTFFKHGGVVWCAWAFLSLAALSFYSGSPAFASAAFPESQPCLVRPPEYRTLLVCAYARPPRRHVASHTAN